MFFLSARKAVILSEGSPDAVVMLVHEEPFHFLIPFPVPTKTLLFLSSSIALTSGKEFSSSRVKPEPALI